MGTMAGAGAVKVLGNQGAGPRPHWAAPPPQVDVLVIEESPVLRMGLRVALEAAGGRGLAVTSACCAEAVPGAISEGSIALLDPSSPCSASESHARECVRALVAAGHRVVVHTSRLHRNAALVALSVGAILYVDQSAPAEAYVMTLRAALAGSERAAGRRYADPTWPTPEQAREAVPVLTARERAALVGYAKGLPLKLVSRSMGVAEYTARTYLDRVRTKYHAAGRPIHTRSHYTLRAVEDCYLGLGALDPIAVDSSTDAVPHSGTQPVSGTQPASGAEPRARSAASG